MSDIGHGCNSYKNLCKSNLTESISNTMIILEKSFGMSQIDKYVNISS